MRNLFALIAGSLFGLGLLVAGMTDAAKVQAFLDVTGAFDLTLAFVLIGAVLPMILVWRIAARQKTALLGTKIPHMPAQVIDAKLIGGSLLFGIGWGLVGLCPGPSIAILGFGGWQGLTFFAAMAGAMAALRLLQPGRKALQGVACLRQEGPVSANS